MNDATALAIIQNMKLEILRKDAPHALFINGAGTVMFYKMGTRAEELAEHMEAYDLVGVYDKRAKLANILKDCGL